VNRMLGLVTIGQTPRPDLEAAFRAHAPDAEIVMRGALDGLSRADVSLLARGRDDYPLLVRLADGSTAEVPLQALQPCVEAEAARLAEAGAGLVVVLCAGGFPEIACRVPVLLPGRIVPSVVAAISRTRHIGVVTPLPGQVPSAKAKWEADGFAVRVTSASPFAHEEIGPAAAAMADPRLELVVLDCMGHRPGYRDEFARRCGRPVLLSQSLVARIVGELVAG
jgi:protein AroM